MMVACTSAPAPDESIGSTDQVRRQAFARIEDLAEHKDLREIRVDDIGWDDLVEHYPVLDSAMFKVLWPDSNWVGGLGSYDRAYVHGWKELDKDHVLLSLLTLHDDSYCAMIECHLRTRDGRSLGNFEAAASCSDGGWTYDAFGRFDSAGSYYRTSVEVNLDQVDSNNVEIHACDSVIALITFGASGPISEKRISAVHFDRTVLPTGQD